ncbi:MAG: hypothetical protein GC160_06370 [Acidobacteria bacterium]|nr:hypothetical protein [Acidobacteriota bacterium]
MRGKLLLALVIGAWVAGTPFMWMVATRNFQVVERVLAEPPAGFEEAVRPLPPENVRAALRYQASTVNRLFFEGWGWTQLLLAAALVGLAWASGQGTAFRTVAVVCALIALFLQLYVVPETIRLGELMDFDRNAGDVAATFWRLHHTYTGLDLLKFFLLIGCGAVLVRKG